MEDRIKDLERRMGKLEERYEACSTRLGQVELQQALNTAGIKADRVRGDKLDTNITWFWRIVAAAITTAFLGWMLSGGLVIAGA